MFKRIIQEYYKIRAFIAVAAWEKKSRERAKAWRAKHFKK